MRFVICACLTLLAVAAQAQSVGTTVPRVNAAAFAGGAGMRTGYGYPMGGGRGIHGVTRRTFMGDANAVAAGYFNNAGVRFPAAAANSANQASGAYFGHRPVGPGPVNRLATGPTKPTARQEPGAVQARAAGETPLVGAGGPRWQGRMPGQAGAPRQAVPLGFAQPNSSTLKAAATRPAAMAQRPPTFPIPRGIR